MQGGKLSRWADCADKRLVCRVPLDSCDRLRALDVTVHREHGEHAAIASLALLVLALRCCRRRASIKPKRSNSSATRGGAKSAMSRPGRTAHSGSHLVPSRIHGRTPAVMAARISPHASLNRRSCTTTQVCQTQRCACVAWVGLLPQPMRTWIEKSLQPP